MASVEERVQKIAERVAASQGLEVVEVELHGGGKARMLRITIDRDPGETGPTRGLGHARESPASTQAVLGVTHEDCSNLSREVSTILDVEEVIPGASYTLEV